MDAIEALDDGANAHFTWQSREIPGIVVYMQMAYYISSYVGIGVFAVMIIVLLLLQKRYRAALAAVLGIAAAFGVIALLQTLVPRPRPQLAIEWLGEDAKTGSYPAAAVFLFMLCAILFGCAVWDQVRGFALRGLIVLILALLTVWVCMSQFFLAMHYVSDVIGAAAGATLIGWLTCRVIQSDKPWRQD
jgi:membrane-associated phospholipid phosphatase